MRLRDDGWAQWLSDVSRRRLVELGLLSCGRCCCMGNAHELSVMFPCSSERFPLWCFICTQLTDEMGRVVATEAWRSKAVRDFVEGLWRLGAYEALAPLDAAFRLGGVEAVRTLLRETIG